MLPDIVNFNTSYVVIKPFTVYVNKHNYHDFNTSYVVIKRGKNVSLSGRTQDFNTSYVVIKHNNIIYAT